MNQKYFRKKWTLTSPELNSTIITTILATLLLLTIWPKFLNNTTTIPWYAYLLLTILFSLPILRKGLKK